MEQVLQAAGLCLIGALLALVVKRGSPETALLLTLAAAAAVLFAFLRELAEGSGVPAELFAPLYKIVGIGLVVRVGGGLCRDAGESALAGVVETAGAVCALASSLPLLRTVLELLLELMG